MGDFNWSTPNAIGEEWLPTSDASVFFGSPGAGVAMRFRPGAITPVAVHRFHPDQYGTNPGIALEIVDTLMPTISVESHFPGSASLATGSATTWENQSGSTTNMYQSVDDKTNNLDFVRNVGGIQTWEQRSVLWHGNDSALTGKRISAVIMLVYVRCASFTNTDSIGVEGQLSIGGNMYYGPMVRVHNGLDWYTVYGGAWRLNPATSQPWTQADVNNLVQSAGTSAFGVRVSYPSPSAILTQTFQLGGVWLDVYTTPENRFGSYYDTGKPLTGWQRFLLSNTAALSANTWYWLVQYPLIGGSGNYIRGVQHADTKVVEASTASAATGEHRQLVTVGVYNNIVQSVAPDLRTVQGAAVTRGANGTVLAGTLIEVAASAINSQSEPYTYLEKRKIASDSAANIGQQITSAAATTYGAVKFGVGWHQVGVRPDRELTIEVRHGAGSLTGGGTLDATATIQPDDIDGSFQNLQVAFASSFLSILNTQYVVLFRSSADTNRGWDIARLDTQSNAIDTGSGTTVAMIEGATQGGTTDTYCENGTTSSRYDIGVDIIAGQFVPGSFTATFRAATPGLYPPRFDLTWTATALGAAFKAYRVWARPSRTPTPAWLLIAEIDVNAGQTAATVEANHNKFTVFDAGWNAAQGPWVDGWDFAVTVVNANNNQESPKATSLRNMAVADTSSWLVSNDAPWLNTNVRVTTMADEDQTTFNAYAALGRDLAITRGRTELPARRLALDWNFNVSAVTSEDDVRMLRAGAISGRQMVLLVPTGDRIIGSFSALKVKQQVNAATTGSIAFIETARNTQTTDFNLPCGVVLNGSTQCVTHGDNALINAIGAFTLVLAVSTTTSGAQKALLGKGNQFGGGNGYGFAATTTGNQIEFYARGVSALADLLAVDATIFNGSLHVLVGTSTGSAQALYRDGLLTPIATASVTHGSASNAVSFAAGADNGGASAFQAETVVGYAYYPRALSAAEAQLVSYYLLGYPNVRPPGGANLFVDLRDKRTWNGLSSSLVDLSGNGLNGSVVAAPPARGLPWPLADLDRF